MNKQTSASFNLKLNKMKKTVCIAMVLISLNIHAQNIQVGFTTGLSTANYKSKVDGNTESGKVKAGFTAGVLIDIPAGQHFSFQPALNFVQKGTKDEQTFMNVTQKIRINVNCIELPLNLLYNTRGKKGNFFVGAGPSFAIAISGKLHYTDGTNSMSEKLKFGNGDDDFIRPIDLGANFVAGYAFPNGAMISFNYNTGLNNLFPQGSGNEKLRSNYFGIRLGYLLKNKVRK